MRRTGLIPIVATALLLGACGTEAETDGAAAGTRSAELSTIATETVAPVEAEPDVEPDTDTDTDADADADSGITVVSTESSAEAASRERPAEDFLYSANESSTVYGVQAEGIGCFIKFVPEGQQGSDLFSCDIEFTDPPLTPDDAPLNAGAPMNRVSNHAGSNGFEPSTKLGGEPIRQVLLAPGEITRLGDYDITVSDDGAFLASNAEHWMKYVDGELITDTWDRSQVS